MTAEQTKLGRLCWKVPEGEGDAQHPVGSIRRGSVALPKERAERLLERSNRDYPQYGGHWLEWEPE